MGGLLHDVESHVTVDGTLVTAHCHCLKLDGNGRPRTEDLVKVVGEYVDRLAEWLHHPRRAKKLFAADLERWRYETPAADAPTPMRRSGSQQQAEATTAEATEPMTARRVPCPFGADVPAAEGGDGGQQCGSPLSVVPLTALAMSSRGGTPLPP